MVSPKYAEDISSDIFLCTIPPCVVVNPRHAQVVIPKQLIISPITAEWVVNYKSPKLCCEDPFRSGKNWQKFTVIHLIKLHRHKNMGS